MGALIKKIAESVGEKSALMILSAMGLALDAALWGGVIATPFYHKGWALSNRAWIFFLLFVFIIATIALMRRSGLIVVLALGMLGSIVFGILYGSAASQKGQWPFITWLLYGCLVAILTALVVRGLVALYVKYILPSGSGH